MTSFFYSIKCFFVKPESGLFIKYNTKNEKNKNKKAKKVLTAQLESVILTELSKKIVSSE